MGKVTWIKSSEISDRIYKMISILNLTYIHADRIFCFVSTGSAGNATARIWGFNSIWQQALNQKPAYCLEVINEKFSKLSRENQDRVLLHELLHIPSNFSGALLAHRNHRRRTFRQYHDEVEQLYKKFNSIKHL